MMHRLYFNERQLFLHTLDNFYGAKRSHLNDYSSLLREYDTQMIPLM